MTDHADEADLPFRQLAQHLPTPCWISDAEGRVIWVNDAWMAYIGRGPDALGGEGIAAIHDPEILPEVRRRWAIARQAGEADEMIFPLRGRDGMLRPFRTRVVPVRDSSGAITRWFGTNTDVGDQAEAHARQLEDEARLRLATDVSGVALWDVDPVSDVLFWPPRLKAMFGIGPDEAVTLSGDFFPRLHPDDREAVSEAYAAAIDPARRALYDVEYRTIGKNDGVVRWVAAKGRGLFDTLGRCYRVVGTAMDVTRRKEGEAADAHRARSLQVLNETGAALAAELDLQRIVQMVTDAGVGITGAQFGAFFYNLIDAEGESYMLYTLSGVDRSNFDKFPMPRNTAVFAPTFQGDGVVRSDDITKDPRYGRNHPRKGMPQGHLPVHSYLAVPVISRSGEVIGGLFFGHAQPAMFTDEAEELVRGVAGQAAVAIDNARLFQAAQFELERRRRVEGQQLLLINELNHRVKNTLATVQSVVSQAARSGRSAAEMQDAIEGRLLALSGAHDLLTRSRWEGADLKDLATRAASPFGAGDEGRIRLSGPSVLLKPQQALGVSMAIHELATNAAKYGALSVPAGWAEIRWEVRGDRLELEWCEHGGPPVTPPASRGFGSRLLERGLAAELQGKVRLDFRPEGVCCRIEAPLQSELETP